MAENKMPHPGHEDHLCHLQGKGMIKSDLEGYKTLVRDGKFMCKGCGRVAAKAESLCAPEQL